MYYKNFRIIKTDKSAIWINNEPDWTFDRNLWNTTLSCWHFI